MNKITPAIADTARKMLSDSLHHVDTMRVSDPLGVHPGTVTPWYGVIAAVVIGVTIGLVFIVRK